MGNGFVRRARRGAELLCAAIFAVMFASFVLQIFSRYILGDPIAWTQEVCSLAYVWVVCFGAAAILGEREHVTFNLFYEGVPPGGRRVFAILGTGFVVVVFIAALPGTLDYLDFMGMQRTLSLRIPMSLVFGGFGIFMVLAIVVGIVRIVRLLGRDWQQEP
jgi:TRAP-type C4-dicarboxylate transport system permease small subunit